MHKTQKTISRLLTAGLFMTTVAAQTPSPANVESIENLVNIRFQNDIRLFAVMASLNAAGFNHETPGHEMSDVRLLVRQKLESLDPELLSRLKLFYDTSLAKLERDQPQAAYTSLSLLLSGPPDFKLQSDEATLPQDVRQVQGFEQLAAEVYRRAGLAELWEQLRPRYERELLAYQPILRKVVQETLRYFRIPARIVLDRQIILTADLLDVKDIVNARNLEKTYYIVVGPAEAPENNDRQLEHEYLHFLIDPLITKYQSSLRQHDKLLDLAQRQPQIRREYQNRLLLVITESLIESLQLRMHPLESPQANQLQLAKLFRQGLVLAPYFHRGLAGFEKSELVQLPSYLETLFLGIRDSVPVDDQKAVEALELEARHDEQERLAAAAQEDPKRIARDLFNQASDLMSKEDYEAAEDKLLETLKVDPGYANAYFYLGQIALRRRDLERALEYYRNSSQSTAVQPWVRARSRLSMARIFAHQGNFEIARSLFEEVAAMEGDLKGAPEEARDDLARLPPKP